MLETWKRFVEGLPVGTLLDKPILESWERCKAFDVTTAAARLRRLPLPEIQERLAREASLVRAAEKHLVWALAALEGFHPVIIILTDPEGVVLHSIGNAPEAMVEFGLVPGYDWSERAMGTNGIGTALAFGAPVAVVGAEHYMQTWHNNTCVGAPVFGPDGRLRGAVDISTTAKDGDPARLVLVAFLAHVIGVELGARSSSYATDDLLERASAAGSSARKPDLVSGAQALAELEGDLVQANRVAAPVERVQLASLLEGVAEEAGARFVGLDSAEPASLDLASPALFQRALTHLATLLRRRGGTVEISEITDGPARSVRIHTEHLASPANNLERAGASLGEWLARQLLAVSGASVEREDEGAGGGYLVRIADPAPHG